MSGTGDQHLNRDPGQPRAPPSAEHGGQAVNQSTARCFDFVAAAVEVFGIAVVGVVHLKLSSVDRSRVKLPNQLDVRVGALLPGIRLQFVQVSAVSREHQVALGKLIREQLMSHMGPAVIPATVEGSESPPVGTLTLMPGTESTRVDLDPVIEPGLLQHCAQDDLAHRRATDIAGADEQDAIRISHDTIVASMS